MVKVVSYAAVRVSNGVVQKIDNSFILQPMVKKNKGFIKWYEDKVKV